VAFDTSGALKSSASTKSVKPLAKGAYACNGLYVASNTSRLLKRLFGNPQTAAKRATLAAASRAAAQNAKEVRALAKSFKAAGAGQKKLDASRLFNLAGAAKASAPAVSVALVVPEEWDSRKASQTGAWPGEVWGLGGWDGCNGRR
jgi:hypothetical protein